MSGMRRGMNTPPRMKRMKIEDVLTQLEQKFRSNNSVLVERAAITRDEWEAIKDYIKGLVEGAHDLRHASLLLINTLNGIGSPDPD